MSFFQWGIDLRRRKPKVGALCVILHPVCVSSRCEDENLPQLTDRNSAAVAAVQKGGICTVRSWLFLSNLSLWVLQLLFLELLDFRIPAHTYCQSWGWEQGLHIWFRMSPSLWQCDIRNERCSCCLASLSRAEQGRWCIEILWCWPRQWQHWVPVIMLEFCKLSLFHLSKRGQSLGSAGSAPQVLLTWSWQMPGWELLSKVGFSTNMSFRNERWQNFMHGHYWDFLSASFLWFVLSGFVFLM